jgi:hypothetical protein
MLVYIMVNLTEKQRCLALECVEKQIELLEDRIDKGFGPKYIRESYSEHVVALRELQLVLQKQKTEKKIFTPLEDFSMDELGPF